MTYGFDSRGGHQFLPGYWTVHNSATRMTTKSVPVIRVAKSSIAAELSPTSRMGKTRIIDHGNSAVQVLDDCGNELWYKDGLFHRDGDKPAMVYRDGPQCWYQHGRLHRDNDLPAVVYPSGTQIWYKNGHRHRAGDKPAEVHADGGKTWYKHGKLHRARGKPAVIYGDGRVEYWVNGERVK